MPAGGALIGGRLWKKHIYAGSSQLSKRIFVSVCPDNQEYSLSIYIPHHQSNEPPSFVDFQIPQACRYCMRYAYRQRGAFNVTRWFLNDNVEFLLYQ